MGSRPGRGEGNKSTTIIFHSTLSASRAHLDRTEATDPVSPKSVSAHWAAHWPNQSERLGDKHSSPQLTVRDHIAYYSQAKVDSGQ